MMKHTATGDREVADRVLWLVPSRCMAGRAGDNGSDEGNEENSLLGKAGCSGFHAAWAAYRSVTFCMSHHTWFRGEGRPPPIRDMEKLDDAGTRLVCRAHKRHVHINVRFSPSKLPSGVVRAFIAGSTSGWRQPDDSCFRHCFFIYGRRAWARHHGRKSPYRFNPPGKPAMHPPTGERHAGGSLLRPQGTLIDRLIARLTASNVRAIFHATEECFNSAETCRTQLTPPFEETIGDLRERLTIPGPSETHAVEHSSMPAPEITNHHRREFRAGGAETFPIPCGCSARCVPRAVWNVRVRGERVGLPEMQTPRPFPSSIAARRSRKAGCIPAVEMNIDQAALWAGSSVQNPELVRSLS
jgi:hypothetical protein